MSETPTETAPTAAQDRRTIHLSSYVALGIDEVVDLLSSRPEIELLLERVIQGVLGADAGDLALGVSTVVRVSGGSASMSLSWTIPNGNDRLVAGHAGVSILLVQSGNDPMTELLLTIEVAESRLRNVAAALHAILDGVTTELARTP